MSRVDRITVKLRVPLDAPEVDSVTDEWPTANHQEREIYDMFGVVFDGHPDLRRILMPEDYEGHPQRRDFPIGGEPVIFTHDEAKWLESRAVSPTPHREPQRCPSTAGASRASRSPRSRQPLDRRKARRQTSC